MSYIGKTVNIFQIVIITSLGLDVVWGEVKVCRSASIVDRMIRVCRPLRLFREGHLYVIPESGGASVTVLSYGLVALVAESV